MINEDIIRELVAIEREAIRASESIDLHLLQSDAPREQRRAVLDDARRRRLALYDRVGVDMNNDVWTAHRAIARAEAEAFEWRAFVARIVAALSPSEVDP